MEDRQIIALLFQRAESALEALAKKFGKRLHLTAMNILGSQEDAQECVNDTYFALWNAIPPEEPEPLAPYVLRVGRNTALKRIRGSRAQKRFSPYELSLDELAECIPDRALEETADARALGRAIDAYLDTCSEENRAIFLRRYWFGDSVTEISRSLGLKENTVSVRLRRMRNKLQVHLTEEGFL